MIKKLALLLITGALFGPVAVFYLSGILLLLWVAKTPKRGSNQHINKYKLI